MNKKLNNFLNRKFNNIMKVSDKIEKIRGGMTFNERAEYNRNHKFIYNQYGYSGTKEATHVAIRDKKGNLIRWKKL